jgi:hypothetical protein
MVNCSPSEGIQKRLRAQYVAEDKMDIESMLEAIPEFMMLPDSERNFPSYRFWIEKAGGYRLFYVNEKGEVWYQLVKKPLAEAVGEFRAYLLEYDQGDIWFRAPDHPDYKR